jgi:hypothetical protein
LPEEDVEDVLKVGERLPGGSAGRAERVVARALLGIRQDLVRAADLLEPLLGRGVTVHVGMVLAGEPAVRLLDVVLRRVAPDAEDLVEVASGAHRSCSSSVASSERRLATARTDVIAER